MNLGRTALFRSCLCCACRPACGTMCRECGLALAGIARCRTPIRSSHTSTLLHRVSATLLQVFATGVHRHLDLESLLPLNSTTMESPSSNLMATLALHFVRRDFPISVAYCSSVCPSSSPISHFRPSWSRGASSSSESTDTRSFLALATCSSYATAHRVCFAEVEPQAYEGGCCLRASSCAVVVVLFRVSSAFQLNSLDGRPAGLRVA